MLALERDGFLGPEALQHFERLVEDRETRPGTRIRNAVRLVLTLVPPRAQAEDEATTGEHVDARGFLGQQPRVAIRRARDELAELDRARVLGERSERRERLEHVRG